MMRNIFLLPLLLLLCPKLSAQEFPYFHYQLEKELAGTSMYDIIQDKKGFIWIATGRGVSRFDGYTFRNYTVNNGLTDYNVFNIYEDRFGRIWFNTNNRRLCYYDYNTDSIHIHPCADSIVRHISARALRTFDVAPDSSLLLGYFPGGIIRVSTRGEISRPAWEPLNRSFLSLIAGDSWGGFSVGSYIPPDTTRTCSYEINGKRKSFRYLRAKNPVGLEIPLVLRRRNGNFCILTGRVFIEFAPDREPSLMHVKDGALRVCEDKDSCLWVSWTSGGVTRYAPNALPEAGKGAFFFPSWGISGVMQDHEGGYWITTMGNDLFYIPSMAYQFVLGGQGTENGAVLVTGSSNQLFTFTADGSLYRFRNAQRDTFDAMKKAHIMGTGVKFLCYDSLRDELLIGSSSPGHVYKMDGQGQIQPLLKQFAISISMSTDTLFFLSNSGFFKFAKSQPAPAEPTGFIDRGNTAQGTHCYHNGTLWAGSEKGLCRFRNGTFELVNPHDSLLSLRPYHMQGMPDGRLAFTTYGKGLVIYDPARNSSFLIDRAKGLGGNFAAYPSPGTGRSLWVKTEMGLSRIVFRSDTAYTIYNYPLLSYLAGNDISHVFVRGNEIWMSSRRGLLRFLPEMVKPNSAAPPIHIHTVLANDSLLPRSGFSVLPYTMNALRFSFVGLAYRLRGKVKYHYLLEGLSHERVTTTSPEALFLSLPPGSYTFKVWAENEDGVLSSQPATFSFIITPPFWKTTWFLALTGLVILTAVALLLIYYIRRIRKENRMRENLLEYRQQALASQMNPHFIFNSLNTIQSYMFREDKVSATKYLSRFARLIRLSFEHSRVKMVPLASELGLVRVYLELEAMRFSQQMKWSVDIPDALEHAGIEIPSMLILPYVENAIRHGIMNREEPSGNITVRIYKQEEILFCEIEDDGVGREAAAQRRVDPGHRSAGASITAMRLELICKSLNYPFRLEIRDRTDGSGTVTGTLVLFALPYTYAKN